MNRPIVAILGQYYPDKNCIKTPTGVVYRLVSSDNTVPKFTCWYRLVDYKGKYIVLERLPKTD